MKLRASVLGVLLMAIAGTVSAQIEGLPVPDDEIRFSLAPSVAAHFGYTKYVMDFKYLDEGLATARIKSELKFPLDMAMVGGEMNLSYVSGGDLDWELAAAVHINVNAPWSAMIDDDWQGGEDTRLTQFSHTESDAQLKALMVDLTAVRYFHHGRSSDMGMTLGLVYQHLDYDIVGYEGWQLDDFGIRHDIVGTADALDYEVTYAMPTIGMNIIHRSRILSEGYLSIAAGPVFASDYDNHLLRFKDADADGTGYGIMTEYKGKFLLSRATANQKVYFGLHTKLTYMNISGEQTQKWYGDDPATADYDDTGLKLSKIPHDFSSLQLRLGFHLTMTF